MCIYSYLKKCLIKNQLSHYITNEQLEIIIKIISFIIEPKYEIGTYLNIQDLYTESYKTLLRKFFSSFTEI